ncbi:MAG: hypothetical protein AB7N71_15010, partial [Phycisphaerae bacterium]
QKTYLRPLHAEAKDSTVQTLTSKDWKFRLTVSTPDGKPHPLAIDSSQTLLTIAQIDENLKQISESHSLSAESFLRKGIFDVAEDLFELSRRLGPDFPEIYKTQPDKFRIRIERMAEIVVTMFAIRDTLWSTPTLVPMLMSTVQKPSLWSILTKGGIDSRILPRFDLIQSGARPIAGSQGRTPLILPFDVMINDETALNCRLFVVPAESPLLPTAGVVGVEASHPTEAGRRITLTVLAARRGAAVGALAQK